MTALHYGAEKDIIASTDSFCWEVKTVSAMLVVDDDDSMIFLPGAE